MTWMVVIGEVERDGYWMELKRLDSGIYDEDWKRERERKESTERTAEKWNREEGRDGSTALKIRGKGRRWIVTVT